MQLFRILFLSLFGFSILMASNNFKIGDAAPDFELKDSNGKVHKLSDYKGQIVALYFYPKDFTGGCTQEACNLRDNFSILKNAGVIVLGVSYDDSLSHQSFKEKYDLPFPLLSDTDRKVSEIYGAKVENSGVPKRITYLIDGQGKIMHIFDKVDTANHSSQIMVILNSKKEK